MGTAELAGTPECETSLTPDTEYAHGYLFLINYDEQGLYFDCFLDVSYGLNRSVHGMMAQEKLTGRKDPELHTLAQNIKHVTLRARFVGGSGDPGPYLVKTEDPMDRDELLAVLRAMGLERRKAFLKQAKI